MLRHSDLLVETFTPPGGRPESPGYGIRITHKPTGIVESAITYHGAHVSTQVMLMKCIERRLWRRGIIIALEALFFIGLAVWILWRALK
jgi:hypothetical protein